MKDNKNFSCKWVETKYYDCHPGLLGEMVGVFEKEPNTNFSVCNIEVFGGENIESKIKLQ